VAVKRVPDGFAFLSLGSKYPAWHRRHAHARLRRAQGPPGRGECRLGEDNRADMHLHRRVRGRRLDAFAEFSGKWEKRYPAVIRLWENVWAEFVPLLQFDQEIRIIICTTKAIESINARLRRAVRAAATSRPSGPRRQGTQAVEQPLQGRPQRLPADRPGRYRLQSGDAGLLSGAVSG